MYAYICIGEWVGGGPCIRVCLTVYVSALGNVIYSYLVFSYTIASHFALYSYLLVKSLFYQPSGARD